MRAISITSHPVLLFLDNIQESDPVSLGLVHTVLSDRKGALFFVGCYNEITKLLKTTSSMGFKTGCHHSMFRTTLSISVV
jgi:predicted ATPase